MGILQSIFVSEKDSGHLCGQLGSSHLEGDERFDQRLSIQGVEEGEGTFKSRHCPAPIPPPKPFKHSANPDLKSSCNANNNSAHLFGKLKYFHI